MVRRGLSVRETEVAVAKVLGRVVPRGTARVKQALDPNLEALQNRLTDHLGSRARLRPQAKGGGVIEIQYSDNEDLDRIFWAILG